MEISCVYPGCFNIKKPKRKFTLGKKIATFHRFPIHNPERLKLWLLTLHLDINTPEHALIFKRVCSDNFFDDDFKPSQQGNRRFLKASAVPNIYTVINVLNLLFTLLIYIQLYYKPTLIYVISQPPVYNQPEQTEEQFEESLELDVSMLSIDPPSDQKDLSFLKHIKWIVNESSVIELFKGYQECGSVITKTRKATVGSVLRGKWSSCTDKTTINDLHLQTELRDPVHLSGDGRSDRQVNVVIINFFRQF
uniref:THAP domain-containing protein 1 n=1 Tax=Sinocyclocheilus anshuiensis TaxID=1608454 RepID=A0A671KP52_9TELE